PVTGWPASSGPPGRFIPGWRRTWAPRSPRAQPGRTGAPARMRPRTGTRPPSSHRTRPQALLPHRTRPQALLPHRDDDPGAAPVILASPLTWYWPSAGRRLAPFFPPPVRRNNHQQEVRDEAGSREEPPSHWRPPGAPGRFLARVGDLGAV